VLSDLWEFDCGLLLGRRVRSVLTEAEVAVDRGREYALLFGYDCMRFVEERKFQQEVLAIIKLSLPHQVQAQLRCWNERGVHSRAPRELGVALDYPPRFVERTYLRDDLQLLS